MKFRWIILVSFSTALLAGCSLASDITPPPNYVPPTAAPTLGALYPASAPDAQDGAALFAQNCAPCHGDNGLGNGPQSQQLPVPVPAIGMAEKARSASPAQWFTTVSEGNLDRYMPPFIGALSDQQRWDVVAYVLTLHTTADQVAQGKTLFEANCPNCAAKFGDPKTLAALSEDDLIRLIKNGQGDIPAFGKNLTDDQALAVAIYIRTLSFAPVTAQAVAQSTAAPASGGGIPGTESAAASTQAAASSAGMGSVSGTIQLAGGALPDGSMDVTLFGYDHSNQSANPTQVLDMASTSAPDGSFHFENVALAANRIFEAEVTYKGVTYQSGFGSVKAGTAGIALPPIQLYEPSTDFTPLVMNQLHIYSDFATQGQALFVEIYAFTNSGDKTVIVSSDGATIPFIKLPDGAQNPGYQADQSSAPFAAAGNGEAAPPSAKPYVILVSFMLPYSGQMEIKQPLGLAAPSAVLLIPDGMRVGGAQWTSNGAQVIQNNNYQIFSSGSLQPGDILDFTVSGQPRTASSTNGLPQAVWFGAGALGLVLIAAGAWLYLRDRRRPAAVEAESEFDSAEEIMDAILALDDLHRAGKIQADAYQARRNELKEALKKLA